MSSDNYKFFSSYGMFLGIIVIWGLSWPITKIGLDFMPPYWYVLCRSGLGCAMVFAILIFQNRLRLPRKADIPIVLSVGVLEIGIVLPLVTFGLSYIGTARSALLMYTTPLWATPLVYFLFREKINFLKIVGLVMGFAGLLVLFKPSTFDWHDHNVVAGNGIILFAAMLWALVLVHIRYGKWVSAPLDLFPWQLLLATFCAIVWCVIFEPDPVIQWNNALFWSILYNGVLACAFGFFASITVARRLPVLTTTLGYLGIPIVGIISSAIVFHERLSESFLFAASLILSGLFVLAISSKRAEMKMAEAQ